jgi:membrane-associated protein
MILTVLQGFGARLGPWLYLVASLSVFGEAAFFAGVVLPGESALLVAGFAAQHQWLQLVPMIVVAFLAAVLGDSTGYAVGRRWGPAIRRSAAARRIGDHRWEQMEELLRRRGGAAVLTGRFVALLRAFVPGLAGMSRMPFRRVFLPWNVLGAAIWAPGCVIAGFAFAASLDVVARYVSYGPALLALAVLGVIGLRAALGRRRAVR